MSHYEIKKYLFYEICVHNIRAFGLIKILFQTKMSEFRILYDPSLGTNELLYSFLIK